MSMKNTSAPLITIIGAGMMGSAMSRPATDNGCRVHLVGTPLDRDIISSVQATGHHPTLRAQLPAGVTAFQFEDVDAALDGSSLVICGVSSFGVDWFTAEALPHLPAGMTLLSITKGLELGPDGALTAFPHVWTRRRPDLHIAAVGGPCISFELLAARHTLVHFVSDEPETAMRCVKTLRTGYYHALPATDVIAVETSVALKNAYACGVALAVGMAEAEVGLTDATGIAGATAAQTGAPDANPVYNPQAALFAQSCIEMRRLVTLLGGDGSFAGAIPGAGDLYVTVFGGRTRRLGTLLGRGLSYQEARSVLNGVTLEAVAIIGRVAEALRQRAAHGQADLAQFPLILHLDAIIRDGARVDIPWEQFG